jgi:heat shock protein HtpX
MEGQKAFFLNDPSRARNELNELKQIDTDMSGTIDRNELMAVRSQSVSISTSDKFMEILSTHPNMLKRIKHLSTLPPY